MHTWLKFSLKHHQGKDCDWTQILDIVREGNTPSSSPSIILYTLYMYIYVLCNHYYNCRFNTWALLRSTSTDVVHTWSPGLEVCIKEVSQSWSCHPCLQLRCQVVGALVWEISMSYSQFPKPKSLAYFRFYITLILYLIYEGYKCYFRIVLYIGNKYNMYIVQIYII